MAVFTNLIPNQMISPAPASIWIVTCASTPNGNTAGRADMESSAIDLANQRPHMILTNVNESVAMQQTLITPNIFVLPNDTTLVTDRVNSASGFQEANEHPQFNLANASVFSVTQPRIQYPNVFALKDPITLGSNPAFWMVNPASGFQRVNDLPQFILPDINVSADFQQMPQFQNVFTFTYPTTFGSNLAFCDLNLAPILQVENELPQYNIANALDAGQQILPQQNVPLIVGGELFSSLSQLSPYLNNTNQIQVTQNYLNNLCGDNLDSSNSTVALSSTPISVLHITSAQQNDSPTADDFQTTISKAPQILNAEENSLQYQVASHSLTPELSNVDSSAASPVSTSVSNFTSDQKNDSLAEKEFQSTISKSTKTLHAEENSLQYQEASNSLTPELSNVDYSAVSPTSISASQFTSNQKKDFQTINSKSTLKLNAEENSLQYQEVSNSLTLESSNVDVSVVCTTTSDSTQTQNSGVNSIQCQQTSNSSNKLTLQSSSDVSLCAVTTSKCITDKIQMSQNNLTMQQQNLNNVNSNSCNALTIGSSNVDKVNSDSCDALEIGSSNVDLSVVSNVNVLSCINNDQVQVSSTDLTLPQKYLNNVKFSGSPDAQVRENVLLPQRMYLNSTTVGSYNVDLSDMPSTPTISQFIAQENYRPTFGATISSNIQIPSTSAGENLFQYQEDSTYIENLCAETLLQPSQCNIAIQSLASQSENIDGKKQGKKRRHW